MDNWLTTVIHQSNGRPFTDDEAERIAAYTESLPDRLAAARQVEDAGRWLAKQLGDAVGRRAADWGLPREPLAGDFVRAIYPIVVAMLLDDPDAIAGVVAPFARLAAALDVPAGELAELFETAWAGLARRLDAAASGMLEPYFAAVAAGLRAADPEPALID